jgi:DNA-binding transcriptional LysR family regulator
VLCAPDRDGKARKLHPLVNPELQVDYMLIEPSTRSMSPAARLFAEAITVEMQRLIDEAS